MRRILQMLRITRRNARRMTGKRVRPRRVKRLLTKPITTFTGMFRLRLHVLSMETRIHRESVVKILSIATDIKDEEDMEEAEADIKVEDKVDATMAEEDTKVEVAMAIINKVEEQDNITNNGMDSRTEERTIRAKVARIQLIKTTKLMKLRQQDSKERCIIMIRLGDKAACVMRHMGTTGSKETDLTIHKGDAID